MKKLLVLIAFFIAGLAQAQEERHPIDEVSYRLLQKSWKTSDMMEAEGVAYDGWDQLLNIVYGELRKVMKPATFAALKEAQRAWIKFRDAEFENIYALYYQEMEGTMWRPVAIGQRALIVQQRTQFLLRQYNHLSSPWEPDPKPLKGTWQVTGEHPEAKIEIRRDLTSVWHNMGDTEYQVRFYRISKGCGEDDSANKGKAIHFITMGSADDNQCYYIENHTKESMELRSAVTEEVLKLKLEQ